MRKPEDVSQEAWDAAYEVDQETFDAHCDLYETGRSAADPQLLIARAIMAAKAEEREACAKVAENRDPHWPDDGDQIAAAIRSRKEVSP